MKKWFVIVLLLLCTGCAKETETPVTTEAHGEGALVVFREMVDAFFDYNVEEINLHLTEASQMKPDEMAAFEYQISHFKQSPKELIGNIFPEKPILTKGEETANTTTINAKFRMIDSTKLQGEIQKIIVGKIFDLKFHQMSDEQKEQEILDALIDRKGDLGYVDKETTFLMRMEDGEWKLDANHPETFDFLKELQLTQ